MMPRAHYPLAAALLVGAASAAVGAPATFKSDAAKSTLVFVFTQAGAQNRGHFGRFDVTLTLDPAQPQGGQLSVTVDISSLDTGDKERDGTLRGAELFDVTHFREARFVATSITRSDASHYRANGKLTIRNGTRDLAVPFTLTTASEGGRSMATMAGQVTIRRLDYGVGQGDWKSTEWVGDDVTVSFDLRLPAQQ